jgi:hypothetical protein
MDLTDTRTWPVRIDCPCKQGQASNPPALGVRGNDGGKISVFTPTKCASTMAMSPFSH